MQLILVINRRTRIEYYANKFSTLTPIKPLGLIVHGLCFFGVNVFAIECIQIHHLKCYGIRGKVYLNKFVYLINKIVYLVVSYEVNERLKEV